MARLGLVTVAITATVALGAESSANAAGAPDLKADLIGVCTKAKGGPVKASDVFQALMKDYPIGMNWAPNAPLKTSSAIQNAALAHASGGGPASPGAGGLVELAWGLTIAQMMGLAEPDPAMQGDSPILIRANDAHQLTDGDIGAVVTAILDSTDPDTAAPRYSFTCLAKGGGGSLPPLPAGIAIGQTNSDLTLSSDVKKAGTLGFTSDRLKHTVSFSTQIAAGYNFDLPSSKNDEPPPFLGLSEQKITPYIYYDRQGSDTPTDKSYVNLFSPGLQMSGYLNLSSDGLNLSSIYTISAKYETDDRFKSRAYGAEAQLTPIVWFIPGASGNPWALPFLTDPFTGTVNWSLTGDADYIKVSYPWLIQSLQKTPQFGRVGYDLAAFLYLKPATDPTSWNLALASSYSERFALTNKGGGVRLFTASATLNPTQGFGIGVKYQDGHDLDTLAAIRQIAVTITVKQ